MFWWCLFNNGFCGRGQESGLGEGHWQQRCQHQDRSVLEQGGESNQAAAQTESRQAQAEAEGNAALRQPTAHRPLQAHQQGQLKGDQGTAVAFAQGRSHQPAAHQIEGKRTLLKGQDPGGHHTDQQHRQQGKQPGQSGCWPWPLTNRRWAVAAEVAVGRTVLEGNKADQHQHSAHANRLNAVHRSQHSQAGGNGSDQRANADPQSIGTAHQGVAPTGGKVAATQGNGQFNGRPVQTRRAAQQQLSEQEAVVVVGLQQDQISGNGQQGCAPHRPGAADAAIKQCTAQQAHHRADQGRDGQAASHFTG